MAPSLSVFSNLGGTAAGQVDVSRMTGRVGTQVSPLQSPNSPSSSPSSLAIPPSDPHSHLTSIRYLDKPVHTFDDPRGHYQLERRDWKGKEKERAEREAAAQEEEEARTRRRRGMRVASSPGTPTVSIPIVVPRPPVDVSATLKAELDIYRATRPSPSASHSQSSSHTTTTGVPVDGGRSRRVVDQNVLLSAAATSLGVFDYDSMLDEDRLFDEEEPQGGSGSLCGSGTGDGSRGARDELVAAALELKLQDLIDAKEDYPDTAAFPLPGEAPSPSSSSNLPLVDVLNGEKRDPSTNTNTNGSASSSSLSSSSFDVTHLNPGPRVAASPLPSPVGVEDGGGEETVALVPIEWNGPPRFLQPSPSSLHPPTIQSNQLNSSTASSSSLVTTPHQPASPLPTTTSLAPASSAEPTPTQPLSPARPRPRGIILQSPSRGHNPSPSPPPTAPLPPVPTTTTATQTATRRPVLRPTERVVVQGPNFGGSPDLAAAEPRGRGQVRMESERVTGGSGAREESEEEREERIRRGREDRCERWRRGIEIGSGSWDEERRRWVGMVEQHEELEVEELGDAVIVKDEEVAFTRTEEEGEEGEVERGRGDELVEAEERGGGEKEVQVGGNGLGRVVVGWFGGFVRR